METSTTTIVLLVLIVLIRFGFPIIWNRQFFSFKALVELMGSNEKFILIDVRTPKEYRSGHIPGAKNMPREKMMKSLAKTGKNIPLILYCQTGQRARSATRILRNGGFTDVRNFGAVSRWKRALES